MASARRKDPDDSINVFRLNDTGLARVLGSLEAEIMEIIWASDSAVTIREVRNKLLPEKRLAFNTVMTVMNRLVNKGLLVREEPPREEGTTRSHRYRPAKEKARFLEEISRDVTTGLISDFGNYAVAQFVDALDEVDPELLDELESLIRQKRKTTNERDARGNEE